MQQFLCLHQEGQIRSFATDNAVTPPIASVSIVVTGALTNCVVSAVVSIYGNYPAGIRRRHISILPSCILGLPSRSVAGNAIPVVSKHSVDTDVNKPKGQGMMDLSLTEVPAFSVSAKKSGSSSILFS